MFRFEKLDVWHKTQEMADEVYRLTREFPDYERYGLANQMRRAVVSVSSNIAEGSGRSSDKDFARFKELAYGSLMELVSQIHIAENQEFITMEATRGLYRQADEIARMLSGLQSHLRQTK